MTIAARELHVTHGTVSRQIQNLERALVTLFERSTRTLRPTPRSTAAPRLTAAGAAAATGLSVCGPPATSVP